MATTILPCDRASAWNICLVSAPPEDRPIAGTYQPLIPSQRFLTWKMFIDDFKLCFDLPNMTRARGSHNSNRVLAIWFRQLSAFHASNLPCVFR